MSPYEAKEMLGKDAKEYYDVFCKLLTGLLEEKTVFFEDKANAKPE